MAYEVIARKWRPKTFDEVVGQEAITRTLGNAVAHERLHHAYLFTGARGVGKTTTARILAKSLNCATGVTPEPCGVCASCVEIASGGSLDVIEIDAASHTGVDNIRDVVINSVNIAPARDRYKIFIVDEVHQLSTAAFNALLKTLEEPPSRVVFVLATTELHKVPDTIVSRCQLFEFRTIPLAKIQAKLGEIAADMGVAITPAALAAVARAGEGSMRDAQSALDQVIAFAGESVDMPEVITALGVVGDATLYDAVDAISRSDAPAVLRLVTEITTSGHDLRNFVRSMMRALRNLLVVRAVGYDVELVDAAEADAERVADLASRYTEAELVRAFSMLAQLEQEIRHSADPRFQLEIGLVRLAELPRLRPLDEILERLKRLESRLGEGGGAPSGSAPRSRPEPPPPAPSRPAPARKTAPGRAAPERAAPERAAPEPPPYLDDAPPLDAEPPDIRPSPVAPPPGGLDGDKAVAAIRAALEASNKMMLITAIENAGLSVDGSQFLVRLAGANVKYRSTLERSRSTLESLVREAIGRTAHLAIVVDEHAAASETVTVPPPLAPSRPEPAPAAKPAAAASDPIVQSLLDVFKGEIVSVEPPEDGQ